LSRGEAEEETCLNINHFYNLFKPSDIMSSYRRLKLICI